MNGIRWAKLRQNLPRIAVFARYTLPLVTGLVWLVLGCFYTVSARQGGLPYRISPVRLYVNTLTGARTYLAGNDSSAALNAFYGLLAAGAVVGILAFLLALFLNGLAAVTAWRALRAGHESDESNRMKRVFKIAFPNRVCLFLANALWLIPALYPLFLSKVGTHYLQIGLNATIFVRMDWPLLAVGILTLLTLVLAVSITRFERAKKMNMFLVWHPEEQEPSEIDKDFE